MASEKSWVFIGLRVRPDLHQQMQQIAGRYGLTVAEFARLACHILVRTPVDPSEMAHQIGLMRYRDTLPLTEQDMVEETVRRLLELPDEELLRIARDMKVPAAPERISDQPHETRHAVANAIALQGLEAYQASRAAQAQLLGATK